MTDPRKLLAEFIGTFALIFIGVSSICITKMVNFEIDIVGIALAHGLAIAVMVSALGHVSGGHFNPAVTIGAFVGRKIGSSDALNYIIAQLAGGFVGAFAVKSVFSQHIVEAAKLGTPLLADSVSIPAGILMESILTFFLVIVVYGTAIDSRAPKMGGLFIGLTVALDILAGGYITGASMNPARTFGPALAGGYWDNHFVYWLGPMIGGIAGGLLYTRVFEKQSA